MQRSARSALGLSLLAAMVIGCSRSSSPAPEAGNGEFLRQLENVCDDVANHIVAATNVTVTADVTESASSENCVLAGQAPAVERADNPMEQLRNRLGETGFDELRQYAADGPGTSSFGFERDGVTCVLSGGVPASLEDGEIVSDTVFSINAVCTPQARSADNPF